MRLATLLSTLLALCTLIQPVAAQPYEARLELVADNLTNPLVLTEAPDGSGRLFIADQIGQIWIVTAEGERLGTPFLDLRDRLVELNEHYDERGLLGLAFHPDYAANSRFFVFYSAPLTEDAVANFDHTNHLVEFRASETDANRADPTSARVLLSINHPYMNHNAGALAFGPDSLLYVALGDGGHRDDEDTGFVRGRAPDWYAVNDGGNGQDIEQNLLGSILRIDVSTDHGGHGGHHGGGMPYQVPDDNPFTGIPGVKGEIYAYGFRNPWRFSFDRGGEHGLIVGDVGQNLYEEISVVTAGGNYGWNVMEGRHCFNAASPTDPFDTCPQATGVGHPVEGDPLVMPVIELRNAGYFDDGAGLAVVGGYVNRGDALPPAFAGQYIFGLYSRGEEHTPDGEVHLPGRLLVATPQDGGPWPYQELRLTGMANGAMDHILLSFGQDLEGNLYVLGTDHVGPTGSGGVVYRLVGQ